LKGERKKGDKGMKRIKNGMREKRVKDKEIFSR
jgi:hypothetical protein